MTVIARDAVAADHLVYAWPFPIGPECEVSCAGDEQVVMCPAWLVGDRLGPGHHRWRTPDPSRPVHVYFVLTAPVEVSYDMQTMFMIPSTGQPVRLRATGSLQVACNDPGLLIAQFVGLPFDAVNDGILRSVSRSIERMLARMLTRRVVMAGTPAAATDPSQLASIVEELSSYNPAAGAVFGVDLMRLGHMSIQADDGSRPWHLVPQQMPQGSYPPANNEIHVPPMQAQQPQQLQHVAPPAPSNGNPVRAVSGEIGGNSSSAGNRSLRETAIGRPPLDLPSPQPRARTEPPVSVSGEISPRTKSVPPGQFARPATPMPMSGGDEQGGSSSSPGMRAVPAGGASTDGHGGESRGSIVAIGATSIGAGHVAGEIPTKVAPGARVLVPGPNGLMQSATVRQLQQGYYELEVGSTGQTIWVPINGVVPE